MKLFGIDSNQNCSLDVYCVFEGKRNNSDLNRFRIISYMLQMLFNYSYVRDLSEHTYREKSKNYFTHAYKLFYFNKLKLIAI